MEKIGAGLKKAVSALDSDSLSSAAKAILTTDKFIKIYGTTAFLGKKKVSLVGFGKGAGMIEPAMRPASHGSSARHATMLAYFMTDLAIPSKALQAIFNRVVDATFNRITVDGDMSTNDTALILANGLAGNKPLRLNSREAKAFEKKLEEVARALALKMVEDGEGATKVVEIFVKNAKNEAEAKRVAYAVGRSPLVKTSFFGQDPNWGRILAAIGYSGATFDPSRVDIYYGPVRVVAYGIGKKGEADRKAHEVMKSPTFTVTLDLKKGKGTYRIWTSDMNYDYVKLNADFST
jgi:glutamate N-acetyltransferase/amino-acid N-acetyltransferase